ncbi:MAG: FRG domain-containing protein [Proteobacteria bacterium]|nr:FRG domain-containing protein [Pseudomonadota bacterium]
MVKVNLPEADASSGKYTEYSFENAEDFYDTLLNLSDNIDKNLGQYIPAMNGQNRWIYRGHWNSDWELLPSAFRKKWHEKIYLKGLLNEKFDISKTRIPQILNLKKIKLPNPPKEYELGWQIMIECDLLGRFMEIANSLGIECNYTPSFYEYQKKLHKDLVDKKITKLEKWPDIKVLPLMSLAQHHGIPTRLLDFTYNPLFAAFFAASHPFEKKLEKIPKDKKLCIWAINEGVITNFLTRTRDNAWHKIPAPSNRSGNIFAQEGLLLLDPEANKKFNKSDHVWQDFQTIVKPECLTKLTLPQSECKNLLRLLWEHDITPARIKPNLDRVAETLEYTQWLWTEK